MGNTRITQAYRLDIIPQPECQTCQRTLSAPHILWECRSFEPERVQYGIDQQILADTVENVYFSEERYKPDKVIKNIGLYNEI
jgi:hypothetical protein